MFSARLFVPIVAYAIVALLVTVSHRRIGGLLGLIVCSYCGVMAVTFTRGTMGSILLPQVFILAMAPFVLFRRSLPAGASRSASLLTGLLFGAFAYGILIAAGRYDPELTAAMRGRFTGVAGIPLSVLMTGYRAFVLVTLVLAFVIPLKYVVDRATMFRCLLWCWIMTVALSIAGILQYARVFDFTFELTTDITGGDPFEMHRVLFGFRRAALGMMMVAGIFLSYGMTQLTENRALRLVAWCTAPLMILALLFTWSRAAMLGMAIGSISLVITLGGRRAIRGVILTLFGVAVIWIVLRQFPDVEERMNFFFTGELDMNATSRLSTWALLVGYLFKQVDVLLFGAGFQNFNYFINVSQSAVRLNAAHNNYLQYVAEFGIGGFLVFAGWAVAVFMWLIRWRRETSDPSNRVLAGVFMSLFVAVLAASTTQESLAPSPSVMPWLIHFYLLLGLFVSWYRGEVYTRQLATTAAGSQRPLRPEDLARFGTAGDPVVY